MTVNFTTEKFVDATLSLGFDDFAALKCLLQKENRSKASSLWGKLASIIFGVNRDNKRSFLSGQWRHNIGNIQELLSEKMVPAVSEFSSVLDKALGHVRYSIGLASYLDIMELGNSISLEYFSIGNIERQLFDNALVSIWASGCDDRDMISKYHTSLSPLDSDDPGDCFCHGNNCDSVVWLESLKFYGLECPIVKGGFILVNQKSYETCQKFVIHMLDEFEFDKLMVQENDLLQAWLIFENISCRSIKDLFGKSYLVLKPEQINVFLLFLDDLRENSESFSNFYDNFSSKIFEMKNKSKKVTSSETQTFSNLDCGETQTFSNLDCDSLLIDQDSNLAINEVIADQTVCKKEIEFTISINEWNQITSFNGDNLTFSKDWTNLFNSKIENDYHCVLSFKYKKFNKINSRKHNCCFFKAKAVCKFSNCFDFFFRIRNNPFNDNLDFIVVNYTVSGTLSHEHNNGKTIHARHLSSASRIEVAKQLSDSDTAVCKYFYEQFSSSTGSSSALDFGNFNKIRSANVLRKVKFDLASLNRLSNDNWIELTKLQEHYLNTILNKHINGYIQSLSYSPFIIHLYTENQIKVLKLYKNKRIIVHLDATGSIVRKLESSQKRVYYYALTIGHPDYTTSPIPIAEMISSAHSSAEISYFLHKWSLDAKNIIGSSDLNIGLIEIDYSWALIHSVCSAFLKCDLETYLNNCWTKIEFDPEGEFIDYNTIVHLCSAHLLHGITFHVNKKFKLNKNAKKLLLHSIGFIIRSSDMSKINNVFNSLCLVFLSKQLDDHVKENILNLDSLISNDYNAIEDKVVELILNTIHSKIMIIKLIGKSLHLEDIFQKF